MDQQHPGIEVPPGILVDALRGELAAVSDDRFMLRAKVAFLHDVIAQLQQQIVDMSDNGHTHDDDPDLPRDGD